MTGFLLSIDPDPEGGSWVLLDETFGIVDHAQQTPIDELTGWVMFQGGRELLIRTVLCEGVQSYGMPVGASTFETVKNIGHIRGACNDHFAFDDSLTRPKIKAALCNSARAKDANVRRALIDLFPATGGGKTPQIGVKKQPGPLYGLKADEWAALALALVWLSGHGIGPLAQRDAA